MTPTPEQVEARHEQQRREAEEGGYHFNPDREATLSLIEGILVNEERYGYGCCPCRLAAADKARDLDIICPCDYRDPDLDDYGACYCALYVSDEVLSGEKKLTSIPERRPAAPEERLAPKTQPETPPGQNAPQAGPVAPAAARADREALPLWRCRVCGYLCMREQPPGVCPICKAKRERFERLYLTATLHA